MLRGTKAIKRLRATAFVIAVCGLLLASLYASRREPPLVRIGEINPSMNFSTVRVQGVLESKAHTLQDGDVLYLIADETGSLPVFSSHAPEGKLPKAGSQVAATGRLSVSADNRASMRVRGPGRIKVLENAAPTIIRGLVAVVWSPPPDSRAPYRMILDRPEGQMEVVYWFVPEHRVTVGARVEVKGTLSFYKGRMQLKVRAAEDIRFHQER